MAIYLLKATTSGSRVTRWGATQTCPIGGVVNRITYDGVSPLTVPAGLSLVANDGTPGFWDDAYAPAPVVTPVSMLLFTLIGANMNTTADQPFTAAAASALWVPDKIIATNASGAITAAVGGIYTSPGKAGAPLISASQNYGALATSSNALGLTLVGTDLRSGSPILSLTTPQGTARTVDFYITGTVVG